VLNGDNLIISIYQGGPRAGPHLCSICVVVLCTTVDSYSAGGPAWLACAVLVKMAIQMHSPCSRDHSVIPCGPLAAFLLSPGKLNRGGDLVPRCCSLAAWCRKFSWEGWCVYVQPCTLKGTNWCAPTASWRSIKVLVVRLKRSELAGIIMYRTCG